MYDGAIADFTRALELDPHDSRSLYYRGRSHRSLKQYEDAVADFTMALDLDPADGWAYYFRGSSLNSLGRGDEATLDFEAAVETSVDESLISLARKQLTLIEDGAAG